MSGGPNRTAFAVAGVAGAALALAGAARARQPEERPEAPGAFTDIGRESIHHLSSTAGSGPTVVFESALSCPCTEWGWILRSLDGRVPYLAYDRPGNGWSSQNKPAATSSELNLLTRRLLHELGLPGPFLLVGHSVGGLLARTFARNYAADLAGIVLVDSSHPDQLRQSALQREGMPLVKQGISRMYRRARYRLLPDDDDFGAITDLPAELVDPTGRIMRRPEPWAAARRELAMWNTEWAPQAATTTLPDGLPLGVVTAGQQASMDLAHGRMQAELARLSTVSVHEVVPSAEHDSLVMNEEQAENVTSVIEWALERHAGRVPTGR